jgi:hypothetical protein
VLCHGDDAKFPPETAFFTDKMTHIMCLIWLIKCIQSWGYAYAVSSIECSKICLVVWGPFWHCLDSVCMASPQAIEPLYCRSHAKRADNHLHLIAPC